MKNQKGITLIALVITIIVLLILAGVSIAMLIGQNGILTQAQNASEATIKGEAEEAVKLALNTITTNNSAQTAGVNYNTTNSITALTTPTAENVAKVIKNNNTSCYVAIPTGTNTDSASGATGITIYYRNNKSANKEVAVTVANGIVKVSTVQDATTSGVTEITEQ